MKKLNKNPFLSIVNLAKKPSKLEYTYGVAAGFGAAMAVYGAAFYWPQALTYDFASTQNCVNTPTLLPKTLQTTGTENYTVTYQDNLRIAGQPIYAKSTCFSLTSHTENGNNTIHLQPLGISAFAKSVRISNSDLPQLSSAISLDQPIATTDALTLQLNQPDATFRYQVRANQRTSDCAQQDTKVSCDLKSLALAQSTSYDLAVQRKLGGKTVDTALEATIQTVSPITITGQSISPGSTVYDSPTTLTITTDKEIDDVKDLALNVINEKGEKQQAKTTQEISGTDIRITFAEPLAREKNFELYISEISAKDGSYLPTPYSLAFSTSGGPKIVSVNSLSYGVDPNKTFLLSADYGLLPGQDLQKLVTLKVNGQTAAFSGRVDGKLVRISPSESLPRCTSFSLTVQPGLANVHGVASTYSWEFAGRTICQQIFSIGASAQGRSITAYKFGAGDSRVVYVGATHGDELGSKYLLDSWVQELEKNYDRIPAGRTIIVIPVVNPDAFAAETRTNARNVDLNRNFPTANWKSDVVMPGGNLLVGGGGSAPLSEPESKALADFVLSQNPRLVLTYHSKGSLVVANESGDSVDLATTYGKKSGYQATSESKLGQTFAYDTTGAFENWLHEKHSIPTLLIELQTHTTNEFSRNQSALWYTATL